jgi:hypothetical protein
MNSYDLLLHWLSARPRGAANTTLVTDACIALAQRDGMWRAEARQSAWRSYFLDALHRLGHVEPAGRRKWAVVPPVLLWVSGPTRTGEAHLYGARSTTLWEGLRKDFGPQLGTTPQPNGPALWKFVGQRSEAHALARVVNSELYEERGEALLASLPDLENAVSHFPTWEVPDLREHWEVFRVQRYPGPRIVGVWVRMPSGQPMVPGVYRTVRRQPPVWVHVSRGQDNARWHARLLDDRSSEQSLVARWCELARSGQISLTYDAAARTLAVPDVNVPLPVLVDRALRLASGLCPDITSDRPQRYRVFTNITPTRARQAGRVLRLRVEPSHG